MEREARSSFKVDGVVDASRFLRLSSRLIPGRVKQTGLRVKRKSAVSAVESVPLRCFGKQQQKPILNPPPYEFHHHLCFSSPPPPPRAAGLIKQPATGLIDAPPGLTLCSSCSSKQGGCGVKGGGLGRGAVTALQGSAQIR